MALPPPISTLFPYTTLFRSVSEVLVGECYDAGQAIQAIRFVTRQPSAATAALKAARREVDRKSTRLNSSHGYISYAVFCLKKKRRPQSGDKRAQPTTTNTAT